VIKTNLHQALAVFTGCISIKTSYTIAEGNEMYFAQIKNCIQDKIKTHEDLNETLSSRVYSPGIEI
jgi:hypothetical protein